MPCRNFFNALFSMQQVTNKSTFKAVSASRIAAFGFFNFINTLAEKEKLRLSRNDAEGKTDNKEG